MGKGCSGPNGPFENLWNDRQVAKISKGYRGPDRKPCSSHNKSPLRTAITCTNYLNKHRFSNNATSS